MLPYFLQTSFEIRMHLNDKEVCETKVKCLQISVSNYRIQNVSELLKVSSLMFISQNGLKKSML